MEYHNVMIACTTSIGRVQPGAAARAIIIIPLLP